MRGGAAWPLILVGSAMIAYNTYDGHQKNKAENISAESTPQPQNRKNQAEGKSHEIHHKIVAPNTPEKEEGREKNRITK